MAAFPVPPHVGMTLRQWYKGQAIIGLTSGLVPVDFKPKLGELAGEIADILIEEDEVHEAKTRHAK